MAEEKDLIKSAPGENPFGDISFVEQTIRDSYQYPDSMFSPWNPDDLVQKHQDYSLYDEMLKDDQVSVCLQIKKDLVLSSGFDFIADQDEHEDIIEDLKIAICEDPEWSFEEMLEEIISAYEFGFSISEKVFKYRDDGKLSLKWIKTRYPGTWLLHTDEYGNITRYEQQGSRRSIDIPKQSLIHYINKRKFQNPYGTSDLRPAYGAWFTKKHITRWYGVFIEKAASPIPVAKYDQQASQQARTDIYNAIKKFQTKSALAIPKYIELEFLEARSDGEAFIKGINIFNMFIGRSLLIPDLLGFQGGETAGGAYALGKTQLEIFFKHISRRRALLERVINNEIVWPIVLHNFGYVDNYPKFKFRDISREETIETVKLWLDAAKSPFYRPSDEEIDHFRRIINFPVTDKEDIELEEPTLEAEEPTELKIYPTKDGDSYVSKPRKFQPASGLYGNKTNFDLIEKQLDTALDGFLAIGRGAVENIIKDFIDDIDRKKIVQRQKIDKLEGLKLKNVAGLRQKLQKALVDVYKKSKEIAASEIFKSNFAKPIVSEEFLKILEQENYQFIGDWEYNVTKGARLAIIQAIKDGKSIAQVVDIIDQETKEKSLTSLERYARTKFTEVMNKGRLAFFEETKAVAGYQYSAVLDDRTCFAAGTQVRMADLSLKAIETIQAGEYVISGNGIPRRIKARKVAIASNWRRIELEGTEQVCATSTHPFWAVQRGSFSWVEAKDLSENDKIGRIDLRCLQKAVYQEPKPEDKSSGVLQPKMLFSPQKSGHDRSDMRAVQQDISGSQELARFSSDRRSVLFDGMLAKSKNKRSIKKGAHQGMRNLRSIFCGETARDVWPEGTKTLFNGLSQEKNKQKMPELRKRVRDAIKDASDFLQSILLSELGWGNSFRNWNTYRVGKSRDTIQAGSKAGEIFHRLCDHGEDCLGSRRELLAPQSQGFGQAESRSYSRSWVSLDTGESGQVGRANGNTALESACHDMVPNPTGTIGIESIEDLQETAFCYDLEVENDHSYLVGEEGIIVHNTEICRGLHGKKFKAGSQPIAPMHFNCRGILIPITIYEEYEPDTHVGKTPIEQFIEENKGIGFPKQ